MSQDPIRSFLADDKNFSGEMQFPSAIHKFDNKNPCQFMAVTFNIGKEGKAEKRSEILQNVIKMGERPSIICLQECTAADVRQEGYECIRNEKTGY